MNLITWRTHTSPHSLSLSHTQNCDKDILLPVENNNEEYQTLLRLILSF